jgi:hypothetical protein
VNALNRSIPGAALVAALLAATPALAIDTDPLDFVAPPAGADVAALYYGSWSSARQYAKGSPAGEANVHSNYGVLTYVHFFDVLGTVAGAKVVVPAAHVDVTTPAGATASGAGIGDPTLVFPIWLLARPGSRTYFAIVPRIQLPLGAYDRNRISPGAHRFTYALQPGFTTGLTERLSLDVVGDVQLFGKNGDVAGGGSSSQKPLLSVQGHLTYDVGGGLGASVGGYQYWGGETRTRGVSNSDRVQTTTVVAGLNDWATKSTSLQFQYRTDVAVENGSRFDGFQFRFLSVF